MHVRDIKSEDQEALQGAIDRDTFHPGEWSVNHFYPQPEEEGVYHPAVFSQVIETKKGPVAFVRYTKTLRISAVWNDAEKTSQNAKAIIFGLMEASKMAKSSGFSEVVINSTHPKLSTFLVDVMKMTKRGDDHLLAL